MEYVLESIKNIVHFTCQFWFMNCMKSMLAAFVMTALICVLRFAFKRLAELKYMLWWLLPVVVLLGRNKLFFWGKLFHISNFLNGWLIDIPHIGECYMLVVVLILAVFLLKSRRLKRYVKRLPEYDNAGLKQYVTCRIANYENPSCGTGSFLSKAKYIWTTFYLNRAKWVVTKERISPFSVGVLTPYVVIPEHYIDKLGSKELELVLTHEMLHIAGGHLLLLELFSFLKAYWWGNPFMRVCDRAMRRDMELACDCRTLNVMQGANEDYVRLILTAANNGRMLNGLGATFESDMYQDTKRRILNIVQYMDKGEDGNGLSRFGRRFVVLCIIAFLLVIVGTTYPRYTELTDVALYNDKIKLVESDQSILSEIFVVDGDNVSYDREKLEAYLSDNGIEDTIFYLSYGGIMKTPGVGGCGCGVLIDLESGGEPESILLKTPLVKFEEWVLKVL